MKRTLLLSAISLILLASNIPVYANVAPPIKPPPPKKVIFNNLEVTPDAKAPHARLQIPRASLEELRAALANEGGDELAATQGTAFTSTRTIVGGIFLFASLSFAGVWLARAAQRRTTKVVAAAILGTAVIGATAILTHGNAGLPPKYFWNNLPENLSAGRSTHGTLEIEIVSYDGGFKLIVPAKKGGGSDKATGEE